MLAELGASPWLVRHHELVSEAAVALCDRVHRELGVAFDRDLVLVGAALHDVGKVVHPDEMREPGSRHEAAGEQLLLARGIPASAARFCVTHASWDQPASTIEDLLVALADKLWKGKRDEALERRTTELIAVTTQREAWLVFDQLDAIFDAIAADGPARLARSTHTSELDEYRLYPVKLPAWDRHTDTTWIRRWEIRLVAPVPASRREALNHLSETGVDVAVDMSLDGRTLQISTVSETPLADEVFMWAAHRMLARIDDLMRIELVQGQPKDKWLPFRDPSRARRKLRHLGLRDAGVACIRRLLDDLVASDLPAIERDGRLGRVTRDELQQAIRAYGRALAAVPEDLPGIEVYPVAGDPNQLTVDIPLWTVEEGRSDLTLSLTVVQTPDGATVSIDDLRVH